MKLNHDILKGITLEQVKAAVAEVNNDPKIQKAGEKIRGKRHANKAILAECLVDGVLELADKGFKIPEKVDLLVGSLMDTPSKPKVKVDPEIERGFADAQKEKTGIPTKPWAWEKVPQTAEVQKRIEEPITQDKPEKKPPKKTKPRSEKKLSKKSIIVKMVSELKGASIEQMARACTDAGLGDMELNLRIVRVWLTKLGFPIKKVDGMFLKA